MSLTGFTVVVCQAEGCGTALALMPALRARSDVADLVAWLRTGDLDPDGLPWWLRLDSARHAAAHN